MRIGENCFYNLTKKKLEKVFLKNIKDLKKERTEMVSTNLKVYVLRRT